MIRPGDGFGVSGWWTTWGRLVRLDEQMDGWNRRGVDEQCNRDFLAQKLKILYDSLFIQQGPTNHCPVQPRPVLILITTGSLD
jgi:hypothetical protein